MRKTDFAILMVAFLAFLCASCSHNGLLVAKGKVFTVNEGGFTYVNGTVFWDMSRENTKTAAKFEDDDIVPATVGDGNAKGTIVVKRKIGKQITGYLVDLAKEDPAAAAEAYLAKDPLSTGIPEEKPAEAVIPEDPMM